MRPPAQFWSIVPEFLNRLHFELNNSKQDEAAGRPRFRTNLGSIALRMRSECDLFAFRRTISQKNFYLCTRKLGHLVARFIQG